MAGERVRVQLSVMPKGVEHSDSNLALSTRQQLQVVDDDEVQLSVMPKGVEHNAVARSSGGSACATISDAERR